MLFQINLSAVYLHVILLRSSVRIGKIKLGIGVLRLLTKKRSVPVASYTRGGGPTLTYPLRSPTPQIHDFIHINIKIFKNENVYNLV